jgi:hypothetical protein
VVRKRRNRGAAGFCNGIARRPAARRALKARGAVQGMRCDIFCILKSLIELDEVRVELEKSSSVRFIICVAECSSEMALNLTLVNQFIRFDSS